MGSPGDLTIAFASGNIAYVSAVIVLSVYLDQSRYFSRFSRSLGFYRDRCLFTQPGDSRSGEREFRDSRKLGNEGSGQSRGAESATETLLRESR